MNLQAGAFPNDEVKVQGIGEAPCARVCHIGGFVSSDHIIPTQLWVLQQQQQQQSSNNNNIHPLHSSAKKNTEKNPKKAELSLGSQQFQKLQDLHQLQK
jgi:hypothetical protein